MIWGLAFVFQREGMDHIGPFTFTAGRMILSSLVLLPTVMGADAIAKKQGRLASRTMEPQAFARYKKDTLTGGVICGLLIVFANAAEIGSLFQTDDFDAAVQAIRGRAKIAAITRSEHGSVIVAGETLHEVQAARVEKVVDTTGAGDQYAAGFLFGLAQGRPLDVCGRLGSLAAAEVISHYGPRPQVSLRDLAAASGL